MPKQTSQKEKKQEKKEAKAAKKAGPAPTTSKEAEAAGKFEFTGHHQGKYGKWVFREPGMGAGYMWLPA